MSQNLPPVQDDKLSDIPDWLRQMDGAEEMPDWLRELSRSSQEGEAGTTLPDSISPRPAEPVLDQQGRVVSSLPREEEEQGGPLSGPLRRNTGQEEGCILEGTQTRKEAGEGQE